MSCVFRDVFLKQLMMLNILPHIQHFETILKKIQQKPEVHDYYILMGSVKPTMIYTNMCLQEVLGSKRTAAISADIQLLQFRNDLEYRIRSCWVEFVYK